MARISIISVNKIYYNLLLLFVFTLPLSQLVSSRLLLVASIFALFIGNFRDIGSKILKNAWDPLLYFFILVIGLSYSSDLNSGLKVLESNLSFLALPIIFSRIVNFNEKYLNTIFNSFAFGLSVACIISLIHAGVSYNETGEVSSFFFYELTNVLNFQPTYFAYYLIFVITYYLYRSYYQLSQMGYLIQTLFISFLFLMLMLTGGQTAFVSMLLIFLFFILKFITEKKSREKRMVTSLVFLMLVSMFLIVLIDKGARGLSSNDAWDRLILWESAIEATPSLLYGVGTGDYKAVLNEYYRIHDLQKFADGGYNSHNQFIQLLFSNGLLGVISLMLLIGRPLYLAFKNHNLVGILLVFPFLIYGVTEVFLGRYQGVVFFVLVHQLSILLIRSERSSILSSA